MTFFRTCINTAIKKLFQPKVFLGAPDETLISFQTVALPRV